MNMIKAVCECKNMSEDDYNEPQKSNHLKQFSYSK